MDGDFLDNLYTHTPTGKATPTSNDIGNQDMLPKDRQHVT